MKVAIFLTTIAWMVTGSSYVLNAVLVLTTSIIIMMSDKETQNEKAGRYYCDLLKLLGMNHAEFWMMSVLLFCELFWVFGDKFFALGGL